MININNPLVEKFPQGGFKGGFYATKTNDQKKKNYYQIFT